MPGILALVLAAAAPQVEARAACPPYREDLPLRCARGYIHVAPAGFMVPIGAVHSTYSQGPRLGYMFGVAGGVFRAEGHLGVAGGLRFGYGFTRQKFTAFDDEIRYLHVGPELRLGWVGDRLFAYGLGRGGYTQWREETRVRLVDESPSRYIGGHVGLGAGAWGRIGSRFLLGGEAVFDFLLADATLVEKPVTLAFGLGVWL